ncbi:c-type cytochrome [Pendulispora brunnea]|uniref:C-type cytochrome n=1 Tax=Pendulispora brunnea TaxID=2905690 RepID=A0ABZ2KQR1_9BACT
MMKRTPALWMIVGFVLVLAMAAAAGVRSSSSAAGAFFASFGEPIPGIDAQQRARFERGRLVAMRRFAPSEGLGPSYNAASCRACHEKPVTGGGASRYRGVPLEPHSKKTFAAAFEHHFTATSMDPSHARPHATHLPLPFFGVGLLAEIPAKEIMSRADPSDKNHDGIRGKVNFERGFLGRFGRKAQMATLQGFVRGALFDQMGVTTVPVEPARLVGLAERDAPVELRTRDADGAADPELLQSDLADLLAFVALLAPPAPDAPTRETRAGEKAFHVCGCTSCHAPSLRGPRGAIPAYTDLLLHDMGEELADDVIVGEASGRDFRTAPLWGLAAAGPYLHDGRADTVDEAIRAHGGEAARAKHHYTLLDEGQRRALLAFLGSLGGSHYRADGLLPKDAPAASPSALGGPLAELSLAERERFVRGRDFFDHDFRASEGLGPFFNGDACRSCHFEPVLGGAGPADVDVMRHGFLGADGVFEPPSHGDTMAHRFGLAREMPFVDGRANLFERRQTPTLFGAGLIDAIPEEAIRGRADPDDRDGDGVRGIVSSLPGGKIGRFGWKGQMASLEDFVEDAFTNELGLAKSELAGGVFDDVVFFLANLAPPRALASSEGARGLAVFTETGCTACHTPESRTRNGTAVRLYSDLLLHEVAAPTEAVLPQASAGRAFRTPPLWGVGATAPYFHDGLSETLEQAIIRHDAEAKRSRERYTRLREDERTALLTFLRSL